ncbi:MAG: RNA pseudouridine synthase [Treponema sp.]|jgi:23S rRNA pseudouridine1911/1915/1917 synthase|nr:RNA pseudouridine synthase [Treponema sp.]
MNPSETPCGPESRLLYLSGRYLAVNKLPGEAVEGAGPGMTDLPRLLTERYGTEELSGEKGRPFPVTAVHRLDVPVSGCILFARTRAALTVASFLFAKNAGGVEKRYWAVVETPRSSTGREHPCPLPETGELVHWIYHDGRRNKSIAFDTDGPGRRRGILRYRIAGYGNHYLFLEIEPATGRSHQIRAQLAALGLHVKGDLKYGARRSERNGGIRLHARSLAFQDPLPEGETIRVIAPPPVRDRLWEDFEKCASGDRQDGEQ